MLHVHPLHPLCDFMCERDRASASVHQCNHTKDQQAKTKNGIKRIMTMWLTAQIFHVLCKQFYNYQRYTMHTSSTHTHPAYVHTQTDDSKVIIINVMVCARACMWACSNYKLFPHTIQYNTLMLLNLMLQAVSLLPIIETFANGSVVISCDAIEKKAETSWQVL